MLKSSATITVNDLPSEQDLKRQIMLTSAIVWKHELTEQEIENWLSNFKGEVFSKSEERRYGLWLLANFVYYNNDEVIHLCKTLYRDFVHRMLTKKEGSEQDISNSIREILNTSHFYHTGRPGESGAFVLYFFRQANNLPIANFIYHLDNLHSNVSTIVFLDDVTLSSGPGNQAAGYIAEASKKYFNNKKTVLLTFVATEKAIKDLEKRGITVISCIVLDERNKCFSSESNVFHYFKEHLKKCKTFAEYYGKKVQPSKALGYNDCQFVFGFFYNTPDNTLPIFWAENNGWCPIIKRYDKNYDKGKYIELERFI
ncbi:MAG: hypothetical protein WD607_04545 [Candidatus Paceibacterota bacterium]